jgi:hypothetical protein
VELATNVADAGVPMGGTWQRVVWVFPGICESTTQRLVSTGNLLGRCQDMRAHPRYERIAVLFVVLHRGVFDCNVNLNKTGFHDKEVFRVQAYSLAC